jgi:uncharacterized protein
VVVTVPSNVVAGSWPSGGAAWLRGGRPLPYVEHAGPDCENPQALIPVEQIPGSILLVAAGADQVWPSGPMARMLSQRLHEHGHHHGHTILCYPSAGHTLGYLRPALPAGMLPNDLTDEVADKAARSDAWPKAIDFIRRLADHHTSDDPQAPVTQPFPS